MKYVFTALLTLCSTSAFATVDLNQHVSIQAKNMSAQDFIKQISQKTNIQFIVQPGLTLNHKMSIQVKEASLKKVLDFIAEEENVAWTSADDGTIHISAKQ
jgi:type II secretory pathway component GspD/PulD (secretin)